MEIDVSNVWQSVVEAMLFFIPAYIANMAPVILWRTSWWKRIRGPVDFGYKIYGERLFGAHKTYFGLITAVLGGIFGGVLVFSILGNTMFDSLLIGGLLGGVLGFGAILGDLIKSFVKRRIKIKPGQPWLFWDQIDFILGAWVAYEMLSWSDLLGKSYSYLNVSIWTLLIGIVLTPILHLTANVVAFKLKWKDVWW